jgi:NADH dehydrogenase FAD-containing subunit
VVWTAGVRGSPLAGQWVGRNIQRQLAGKEPLPFHYRDKGMLAEIGGHSFTGFLAWWLWLGVNIYYLIGFRNRLLVLINWTWNYFFSEQGIRMIVPAKMTEPVTVPGQTAQMGRQLMFLAQNGF